MSYRVCPDCGLLHDKNDWPANHRRYDEVLCTPNVVRDYIPDLFHPCDNGHYESKRRFREVTRSFGHEEVGDEPIKDRRWVDEVTAADVAEAKQMVDQGYKPHHEYATEADTASIIATAA